MTASLQLPEDPPSDTDGENVPSGTDEASSAPRRSPSRTAGGQKTTAAKKATTTRTSTSSRAATPKSTSAKTPSDAGTPKKPAASAAKKPAASAAKKPTASAAKKTPAAARKPRAQGATARTAPRAPAASAAANAAGDSDVVAAPVPPRPGPPPPLPDDLVIPPLPPLPPLPETAAAEPVQDEPVTEDPVVVEEPAVAEEPVVEEPVVVEEPAVTEDPVVEEPVVVEDPVVEDPVVAAVLEPASVAEASSDVPALALRGVTKSFGGTLAVDGIDLTVPAGSFYGIVGPNGAGKTTTLSMIAGLLRADSGRIAVNGVDVRADTARAKRAMGVLPDRLRTFDRLTGRQLLYYYGLLRGLSSAVVESRIGDLGRAFDLVEALGRPVSDYSAGMTKKVMLAGAMIHSPRLLVLDEPFESVDPVSSAVILDILGTYVDHGGTVILSSHGMELVERVCSRVAVLVAGQVLAEGTVDEVRGTGSLQERFLELAGGLGDVEGLEWLHTFSD